MATESQDRAETIPDDQSIIVVSDLHLGLDGQEQVGAEFSKFLAFIGTLRPRVAPGDHPGVPVEGKVRKLYAPDKIILLGDIVDLWSPRMNSRSSVLEDSYSVIQSLLALPAEIVYVAGNHDEEIAEVEGTFPKSVPGKLKVVKRHYPDNNIEENGTKRYSGIPVGDHRYFFMHGQQFDLMFKTAGLLQNYPGWVAKNYQLFRDNPNVMWFFRILFGFSLFYVLATLFLKITTMFDGAIYILLGFSLVIVLFSIEPGSFRALWDFMSGRVKAKTETVKAIIDDGFWKPQAGESVRADVVVFGHTHVADDSKGVYLERYRKRFINSGSWGEEKTKTRDGTGESETNTFVYIDAAGPLLFRWPKGGPLPEHIRTTLTGDPVRAAPPVSPMKLWMRRNLSTGG